MDARIQELWDHHETRRGQADVSNEALGMVHSGDPWLEPPHSANC